MKSALRRLRSQAAGPPVPMSSTSSLIWNLRDVQRLAGTSESMMRAYGAMSTVGSCVSLLSESVSRVQWKLYRKQPQDARRRYASTDTGSDQRTEVLQHQALSVLAAPNAFYTQQQLFEADQQYLELTGEYYWVLQRAGGLSFPTGIWPVRPDRMEPVADPQKYISGWIYTSPDGTEKIPLATDEVIQVRLPNPLDPMHGLGPVQALLVDVDSSLYSAQWNRQFFLNSAEPGGVVTVPQTLTDEEFEKFQKRWRETHRGVMNTQRVAMLEGGATWTPNQMTIRDMDFAALRNMSRDIVREAFRMHKVMLGVSDDVNRANAQTGEEVFASWGVVPRLDRKKDMLNNVFLPMFGSTGQGVEFDYITPVPANREEDRLEMVAKCQSAQFLVDAGFDPHDVLEVVGLPDMDVVEKATQQPAVPPGWVPAGPLPASGSQPSEPAGSSDDIEARLRRVLANGHRPVATLSGRR